MKTFMHRAGVAVVCLVAGLIRVADGAAPERPNVVILLCDDLGWGDLGCYGHPHIRTPNLDRLAAEGVRLTSCYSAAPVCSPSRVGLLTGRNPNRAGVYDWIPEAGTRAAAGRDSRGLVHMGRNEITLPRLLRDAGYATMMSGKWHCNSMFNHPDQPQPCDAGFDHWFATQNNASPSHENPVNFVRNGEPVGPAEGYSCRLVAREAIEWIGRHRDRSPDRPFFAYVAFHEPHEPVASPPDLVARYRAVARNEDEAQYFANVEHLDAAAGDLLDALDRLAIARDTLVFFSSDNGPETLSRYPGAVRSYGSPGPLRGMKLWTTEAGSRVAGILRWPGRVRPGGVCDDPVSSLDLLPTLAGLAGATLPEGRVFDGTDLRLWLAGGTIERHRPLFWFYYNAINEQRAALRDGPWKLLARLDHEGKTLPAMSNVTEASAPVVRTAQLADFSLHNLTDDMAEASDLSEKMPEKLLELKTVMESIHRELTETMHVWPAGVSNRSPTPKP